MKPQTISKMTTAADAPATGTCTITVAGQTMSDTGLTEAQCKVWAGKGGQYTWAPNKK
jgi:hypothetical protein